MDEMWSRCEAVLSQLDIPSPFHLHDFVTTLARKRGKAIELVAVRLGPGTPCGMLISTDDVEYVYYAANTSTVHADHIALHEIGHLVFGHHASLPAIDESAVRALLPALSPQLIQRVLGRTVYLDEHERQAELFASMVLSRGRDAAAVPAHVDRWRDLLT
ncbi:hypothetical protein [Kibdelosporangium phytohabitans]|uniref:hypothetical protein n=1 Tax=Kibdelosporangium phytohabitans TaxID=860235 RepID=UPI0012F98E64|nr:hypothetical protein [Kibdelosporangium phytohabitans]MBE1463768.1 hypothetical protein [Kibdelosporangium phytohabitans]